MAETTAENKAHTPVFHLMFCTDATWGKGSQAAIYPYIRAETLTPKGF